MSIALSEWSSYNFCLISTALGSPRAFFSQTDLEKLKIDVVDELHKVRRTHLNTPPEEIEKAAAEVLVEIEKRRKK